MTNHEVQARLTGGPFDGDSLPLTVDPDTPRGKTLLIPAPTSLAGRSVAYERTSISDDGFIWRYTFDAAAAAHLSGHNPADTEPGDMLRDFCLETDRINPGWGTYFDDVADVEPFLAWIAADQSRADTWATHREHHGCDDRQLLQLALTDRMFERSGGRTDVACDVCSWSLPSGEHGPGAPERPGNADYVDAAMPLISVHIDGTGHPVNVTLTTFHHDRDDEQSILTFHPRAA